MEWWQLMLLFIFYIVCSILTRAVMATVKSGQSTRPHCPGCAAYGQKAAPVQAPPVVRVINPIPKAPKK